MHAATLRQPLKTTLRVSPLYYDRGQQVVHSGLSYWVEGRGSIIFNRGRSVASWTFTGRVFHHAQRSFERAPALFLLNVGKAQHNVIHIYTSKH